MFLMRKILSVFLFVAVFLAVFPARSHAQDTALKIAVVDVERIFVEASAAKDLEKQINAKRELFQKQFSEKENSLRDSERTLMEQKEKLSAEEFNKKRKEFEASILETRKDFQKSRGALDRGVSQAMGELRKNVIESAAKIADQKGFDVVLTRDSVIIAEKNLDITADVLKALNESVTKIPLKVE